MKSFFKLIFFYIVFFLLFTLTYLCFFHLPILTFIRIFFYRGIILLFINTLIWMFFLIYLKKFPLERIISLILISFSINLSVFVVFPVTFERSVTMYLLTRINDSGQCISKDQLEKDLINEYIIKGKALNKRIEEQSAINFLKEKDDCIISTEKNKMFIEFSKFVNKLYNLNTH
ncbi:MAG: hypothetical protein ACPL1D_00825 [Microgenomates group bacterium]